MKDLLNTELEPELLFAADVSTQLAFSKFSAPEIPPLDFTPDFSVSLTPEMVGKLLWGAFPDLLDFPGGSLDSSRTNEKSVTLYTKRSEACPYSQGHTIQLAFLSRMQDDKRTVVIANGQTMTLDSLLIYAAPLLRVAGNKIFMDVYAQIGWAQDRSWNIAILTAVNNFVQTSLNPSLPAPLFSLPIDTGTVPAGLKLEKAGIQIDGCWTNGPTMTFAFKVSK